MKAAILTLVLALQGCTGTQLWVTGALFHQITGGIESSRPSIPPQPDQIAARKFCDDTFDKVKWPAVSKVCEGNTQAHDIRNQSLIVLTRDPIGPLE